MNKYSNPAGKSERQSAVLDAVSASGLATQRDIVAALRRRGIPATQVSVSRDIAELGLVKVGGVYRPAAEAAGASAAPAAPDLPLRAWLRSVEPAGPHLLVLRCDAGAAQSVGLVIDQLAWPEIVGVVAGDDTLFVAVRGASDGRRAARALRARMAGASA